MSTEFAFVSGSKNHGLTLRGLWGRERLSEAYAFDLLLTRDRGAAGPLDVDALFASPCAIALGGSEHVVRGILASMQLVDVGLDTTAETYVARLVPTFHLLSLNRANRIYQDVTLTRLLESVFAAYEAKPGQDYEIGAVQEGVAREYVVQFQESDWDFVERWLADEGLFYYFEHDGKTDRMCIVDSNARMPKITHFNVPFRARNNLDAGSVATIWGWEYRQKRTPAKVAVNDYNYRTPHLSLYAAADVDPAGFGVDVVYGDHFKDEQEGRRIAVLRAERHRCTKRTYSGRSDSRELRAGRRFQLEQHEDPTHDGEYLLTAVEHRWGEPVPGDAETVGKGFQAYEARFEAISFDLQFRPERRVPWPNIQGVLHAHVDSDTDGIYAQIDDLGRYKVKLPFDWSGGRGTRASRWIRLAQISSGSSYGVHFPLRKGTEVLLTHIDGDPDRPIIVGTVPNPLTASPTTGTNATQSVMRTPTGIRIEMEDLQGQG